MDKAFIGRVYPFKAVSPPEKVLKVGDAPVAGEIATDGQVAGYRFTAPKGRYVIEVNGRDAGPGRPVRAVRCADSERVRRCRGVEREA